MSRFPSSTPRRTAVAGPALATATDPHTCGAGARLACIPVVW